MKYHFAVIYKKDRNFFRCISDLNLMKNETIFLFEGGTIKGESKVVKFDECVISKLKPSKKGKPASS